MRTPRVKTSKQSLCPPPHNTRHTGRSHSQGKESSYIKETNVSTQLTLIWAKLGKCNASQSNLWHLSIGLSLLTDHFKQQKFKFLLQHSRSRKYFPFSADLRTKLTMSVHTNMFMDLGWTKHLSFSNKKVEFCDNIYLRNENWGEPHRKLSLLHWAALEKLLFTKRLYYDYKKRTSRFLILKCLPSCDPLTYTCDMSNNLTSRGLVQYHTDILSENLFKVSKAWGWCLVF